MHLLPGDRVTEARIAERFGVSRTKAREALFRQQSDGLIRDYVRGGCEVVPIDFKRFEDLYILLRKWRAKAAARRLFKRVLRSNPVPHKFVDSTCEPPPKQGGQCRHLRGPCRIFLTIASNSLIANRSLRISCAASSEQRSLMASDSGTSSPRSAAAWH